MKYKYPRLLLVLSALMLSVSSLWAVPAYRVWQERTLADGTTITVRLVGDEFYHFWETQDGKIAKEQPDGTFVVTDQTRPTGEQIKKRRMASNMYQSQPRKAVGTKPNLAPKGVVILANFKDVSMKSSNTREVFDELCNSTNCTVNKNGTKAYGSAAQYFADQSNGAYRPQFDVFGPVTLSQNVAHYGEDTDPDDDGSDAYATDAVVEACILANQQYSDLNFADYDSDNDGYVDFVYVIYAGKGQADGGAATTIWPHNWLVSSAMSYGNCTYTNSQRTLDGKKIENYACSGELKGTALGGIGTLCHEFGHVMGLPDLYDTNYGTNYKNGVTPGEWNIMDGGSYNGNSHCPPNYDPWQKYFFGWVTPENLGTDPNSITLYYNGSSNYKTYQINSSNSLQTPTSTGVVYYLENRQKVGWDEYVEDAGMLVWKINFSSSVWSSNAPNNTANSPRHTIVPADGKTTDYSASGDAFPTSSVKTYTPISGHELTSITKNTTAKTVSFLYNGGVVCHNVVVEATGCKIEPSSSCVENSTQLTATITPTDASYDFTSLTVKRGSTTLTSGTHYTLSSDKKSLTINASAITGNASDAITITAVWTKNRYSYAMLGENCTAELGGTVNKNAPLSVTIEPDAGYTLADASCWDVEMDGETLTYGTDFTYNAGTKTFYIASVTGDVAILAYGGRAITWSANGVIFANTIVRNGLVTLPVSTPDDCTGGKKFVGWCTTSNYEHATVAPTFAKTGDSYSSANYYAVYATATGGGATAWELVTDAASLKSGDVLVIASNTKGKTAGDISSNVMDEVASTFSSGDSYATITSLGSGTVELTLGGSAGAWTLSSSSGLLGATTTKKLAWDSGTTTWSISISDGGATIQNGTSAYGAFLHNFGSTRFTTYSSSPTNQMLLPQLYRKSAAVSYSDYTTDCVICTLSSISLNTTGVKTEFTTDDSFSAEGLVVTANYSNCSAKTVTPTSISTPNMTTDGNKTVTVTYTENDVTKTATYTINVAALVKHTVTWKTCGGTTFKTEQYVDGTALALPSPTPGANTEGKAFYGWIAEPNYTGADAPETISAGGAVTADATYYAIYH